MTIRIGYACINTQLPSSNRTCRLNNATPERVIDLARLNLAALIEILHWNHQHHVQVFRISSETIPLASHPDVQVAWWQALAEELSAVGALIQKNAMRVSMHPGQYTVMNSPREKVVTASIAELEYHARFLDALGLDARHKLVLHLGGVYNDKPASLARFASNFQRLSPAVQRRLVLENDEKSYSLADALAVSGQVGAPVVFDVFHHRWNPSLPDLSRRALVERAAATWQPGDGRPKLHYSDPWPDKPPGAHSQSIDLEAFGAFYQQVQDLDLDIMLEVKDKEQSVLALYERFPALIPPINNQ